MLQEDCDEAGSCSAATSTEEYTALHVTAQSQMLPPTFTRQGNCVHVQHPWQIQLHRPLMAICALNKQARQWVETAGSPNNA